MWTLPCALMEHSEPRLRVLGEKDPILGGKAENTGQNGSFQEAGNLHIGELDRGAPLPNTYIYTFTCYMPTPTPSLSAGSPHPFFHTRAARQDSWC